MAAYYSTNYTKQYVNVPAEKIPAGEQYGVVRVAYDDYTFTAVDSVLNDTITFMKIPRGARILDVHVINTAMGGGTIDIGWTASDDAQVLNYQVEYKLSSDSNYITNTVTVGTLADVTAIAANANTDGIDIEFMCVTG